MNSMRAGWCISLGVHALGFGVLAYSGFFRHPAMLTGDDEQPVVTFTVLTAPEDFPDSRPNTKPAAVAMVPTQPVKFSEPVKPIKASEPVSAVPPVEVPIIQDLFKLPEPIAIEPEPDPVPASPVQPVTMAAARPTSPPPALPTPSPHSADNNDPAQTILTGQSTVGGLARPGYRKNRAPRYPYASLRRHEEGLVLLRVVVSAEGSPKRVELKKSSGFPLLDQAALEAVKDWEFDPARVGSVPMESEIEVPVQFTIR